MSRIRARSLRGVPAPLLLALALAGPLLAAGRRDAYEYDAAGRLVRAVQGDGGEIRWERDAAGNVLRRKVIAALAGDESGDGRVSVADAVAVARVVSGATDGTPRSDCDGNGSVEQADVDCIVTEILDE